MTTEEDVYKALKYRVEVDKFGTRRYYNRAGQRHREEGPAVEWAAGSEWYINGVLHRVDGPAVIRCSGTREWWINGTKYNKHDYYQQLKTQGYA